MSLHHFPRGAALPLLAALDQSPPIGLADLARAANVPLTTAQSGVKSLERAGLVVRMSGLGRPLYRVDRNARHFETLVRLILQGSDEFEAGIRANPAVGVAVQDDAGYLIVLRESSEASGRLSLTRLVEASSSPVQVVKESADLGRTEWSALRARALKARVIAGSIDRFLRDLNAHGDFEHAKKIHALNTALRRPSGRTLRRLSQAYGLARISIHGSAVREDFRPDSDVDVLLDLDAGTDMSLMKMESLREELEGLLERRVDISLRPSLPPPYLANALEEEVTIYERARSHVARQDPWVCRGSHRVGEGQA